MNVLMTADSVGGVWSYALELADALAVHDISVTLAVMGGPLTSGQRAELRRSQVARCYASDFALEWQQDWSSVQRSYDWLQALAGAVDPDLVHVNGYAHAALGWDVPVVVVAHSDVLSWYEAVRRQAAPPTWQRYRDEVARGLAAADLVVAPSRAMLDALLRHHDVPVQTRVIPNGVAAGPPPRPKREVVLAAGRIWDEAKYVAALAGLDLPVEVAGEGRVDGLAGLGRLDRRELRERMAEAAVFCAPARYEPFGLAALEAALAGCALVLGDIPSLREVWSDAALFVDPDDRDALAAALRRALQEHELLGARARTHATRYSAAAMAGAYVEAYRLLVVRQPLPA